MFVTALQDVVLPHFTGKIVNAIQNKQPLLKYFIVIALIIFGIQSMSTLTDWIDLFIFPNMQSFVRDKMIRRVVDMHKNSFAEIDIAVLITKILKLPFNILGFIDQYRYYIFPQIFVFIIACVYLFAYDYILSIIVAVTVGVVIGLLLWSPNVCSEAAANTERLANTIANEVEDIFTNIVSVYSQNTEPDELKYVDTLHHSYATSLRGTLKCVFLLKFAFFPIVFIFISAFMFRCYRLVLQKKLDTGKFVSLFMIMLYITNSIWRLVNQVRETAPRWGRIKESLTLFEVAENELVSPITIVQDSSDHSATYTSLEGIIGDETGLRLENVMFAYPTMKINILKNFSLHVPRKQRLAIVGTIGSGKTTVIKLIMKYYKPTQGNIYWNGISYDDISTETIRDRIGYVHQNPVLFNRSIYDNIVYGLPKNHAVTKKKISDLLIQVGMPELFQNMPNGLDSLVGKKGSKLSGGQRQMVWILRIMFHNPDVIILDEPTASIDDATKKVVQRLLELAMKDKTVIIVTHDTFLMDKVDRIITLRNGSIINDTSVNKPSLYADHFSML